MTDHTNPLNRRNFLLTAGTMAITQLGAVAQSADLAGPATGGAMGRRRLGSLEVSNLGLGVQNMSRTYQTTIPTRKEMITIISKAHEQGVTLFDAAEAYGPHEVERILGEGVAPFRNEVVISSKFGWNIDLETGAPAARVKLPVASFMQPTTVYGGRCSGL